MHLGWKKLIVVDFFLESQTLNPGIISFDMPHDELQLHYSKYPTEYL